LNFSADEGTKFSNVAGSNEDPSYTKYSYFHDLTTSLSAAAAQTPASVSETGNMWTYYFWPLGKGSAVGTLINSLERMDGAPHIILKVSEVTTSDSKYSYPAANYFVTVRKYSVDNWEKGKVYQIADIAFGGEHLSLYPEKPARDIVVKVTVKNWVGVPTSPTL
jgi:hypothetical protein